MQHFIPTIDLGSNNFDKKISGFKKKQKKLLKIKKIDLKNVKIWEIMCDEKTL